MTDATSDSIAKDVHAYMRLDAIAKSAEARKKEIWARIKDKLTAGEVVTTEQGESFVATAPLRYSAAKAVELIPPDVAREIGELTLSARAVKAHSAAIYEACRVPGALTLKPLEDA